MTLAKIRALAEAATQGLWKADRWFVRNEAEQISCCGGVYSSREVAIANAAYIAAAHPTLVLAMIAEILLSREFDEGFMAPGESTLMVTEQLVDLGDWLRQARAATDAVLEEMKG